MMDTKKKLVELLINTIGLTPTDAEIYANDFIAHGVTVQEDCKNCAEATQNCIVKLQEQISELRSAHEWISVDDRLPKNGQEVFIAYVFPLQSGRISKHFHSASIYHIDDGNGLVNRPHFENEGFHGMRVTHWMPLPQPPKGDNMQ